MQFFEKFITDKDTSILESMKIINNGELKIALVVENKKLLGTVTDGDIRRGIINGIDLKDSVKKIMNKQFIYLRTNQNKQDANLIMKKFYTASSCPRQRSKIVDILFLNNQINAKNFDNTVLIMAEVEGKTYALYKTS